MLLLYFGNQSTSFRRSGYFVSSSLQPSNTNTNSAFPFSCFSAYDKELCSYAIGCFQIFQDSSLAKITNIKSLIQSYKRCPYLNVGAKSVFWKHIEKECSIIKRLLYIHIALLSSPWKGIPNNRTWHSICVSRQLVWCFKYGIRQQLVWCFKYGIRQHQMMHVQEVQQILPDICHKIAQEKPF